MLAVDADAEPMVEAALGGSPAAWDQLFHRYQLPLYAYAHELVQNEQTALDIVQETFLSAVRHLGSLREPGKVGSWLSDERSYLSDFEFMRECVELQGDPIFNPQVIAVLRPFRWSEAPIWVGRRVRRWPGLARIGTR